MSTIISDSIVKSAIVRELSIHEASFPVYGELVPGGGNIVVCLQLQGKLSRKQAQEGFQKLMQAEASLQVASRWLEADTEKGNKAGYYFIRPDSPILPFTANNNECRKTDNEFETSVNRVRTQLLNQPFLPGSLLWRAHLVSEHFEESTAQQHCIFLCVNHSVSDGTSVYHLIKRWLLALNSSTNISATANTFSLPLWHYMPKKISGFLGAFRSLGILSTFIKAQKLADIGLSFKAECNVPIAEHRCRSTHRSLDKISFTALLKLTKNNNKSIHGLISAALLQVLLKDCKSKGQLKNIPKTFSLPFVSTVNVRDKILVKHNTQAIIDDAVAGCFSSGVTSMVEVDQDSIETDYRQSPWQLGQQVANGVTTALAQDQHWKVLRIYQLVGLKGLKKIFIDSSEKPLATPISLANLGPVNFDSYINYATTSKNEVFTVKGYQAYAAFHASGAGVNAVASSLNGELTLCLTCPDPVISQQTLDGYADDIMTRLKYWSLLSKN
jgi:hypothetical protein